MMRHPLLSHLHARTISPAYAFDMIGAAHIRLPGCPSEACPVQVCCCDCSSPLLPARVPPVPAVPMVTAVHASHLMHHESHHRRQTLALVRFDHPRGARLARENRGRWFMARVTRGREDTYRYAVSYGK